MFLSKCNECDMVQNGCLETRKKAITEVQVRDDSGMERSGLSQGLFWRWSQQDSVMDQMWGSGLWKRWLQE